MHPTQEENRSISENCTWGQRKRFADGKVTVPFSRFLGYDRGDDGNLVINKEQAALVKRIYGLFLQGMTPCSIADRLTADGIHSPGGKENWSARAVSSIHNWIPQEWVVTALGSRNPFGVIIATLIGVPMYADIFGTILSPRRCSPKALSWASSSPS